jgi:hypothetical protein
MSIWHLCQRLHCRWTWENYSELVLFPLLPCESYFKHFKHFCNIFLQFHPKFVADIVSSLPFSRYVKITSRTAHVCTSQYVTQQSRCYSCTPSRKWLSRLFYVYAVVEFCASSNSITLSVQNLFYHFTYFKDRLFYCQPTQGTHLSVHRTVPRLLHQLRDIKNTGPHQCSQCILCCKSPVPIFSLLGYQNLIFVRPSNEWTCHSRHSRGQEVW